MRVDVKGGFFAPRGMATRTRLMEVLHLECGHAFASHTSTILDEGDINTQALQSTVRERYGKAASQATTGAKSSCGGAVCCGGVADDPITSNLYTEDDTAALPKEAVLASLGCGNPTGPRRSARG